MHKIEPRPQAVATAYRGEGVALHGTSCLWHVLRNKIKRMQEAAEVEWLRWPLHADIGLLIMDAWGSLQDKRQRREK